MNLLLNDNIKSNIKYIEIGKYILKACDITITNAVLSKLAIKSLKLSMYDDAITFISAIDSRDLLKNHKNLVEFLTLMPNVSHLFAVLKITTDDIDKSVLESVIIHCIINDDSKKLSLLPKIEIKNDIVNKHLEKYLILNDICSMQLLIKIFDIEHDVIFNLISKYYLYGDRVEFNDTFLLLVNIYNNKTNSKLNSCKYCNNINIKDTVCTMQYIVIHKESKTSKAKECRLCKYSITYRYEPDMVIRFPHKEVIPGSPCVKWYKLHK
jgi:hypothetical protein